MLSQEDIEFISSVLDTKIKHIKAEFKRELLNRYSNVNNDKFVLGVKRRKYLPTVQFIRNDLGLNSLKRGTSATAKIFYILRGWSEEEAENIISDYMKRRDNSKSPYKIEYWITKGLTEEQAKFEVRSRRILNIEYWLKLGFSNDEAKAKLSEHQSVQSAKVDNTRNDRTISQLGYWLKRGLSEEEAAAKLSEKQNTRNLKKIIDKHGLRRGILRRLKHPIDDKNRRMYLTAYSKCDGSVSDFWNKCKDYKETTLGHASNESLIYFRPLYTSLKDYHEVHLGAFGKKEYKIDLGNKKHVRYDFTILDKKIIIEYDCDFWHSDKCDLSFKNRYNSDRDEFKESIAIDNGFDVLRINSKNTIDENFEKISNFLNKHNINLIVKNRKFLKG